MKVELPFLPGFMLQHTHIHNNNNNASCSPSLTLKWDIMSLPPLKFLLAPYISVELLKVGEKHQRVKLIYYLFPNCITDLIKVISFIKRLIKVKEEITASTFYNKGSILVPLSWNVLLKIKFKLFIIQHNTKTV